MNCGLFNVLFNFPNLLTLRIVVTAISDYAVPAFLLILIHEFPHPHLQLAYIFLCFSLIDIQHHAFRVLLLQHFLPV